MGTILGIAPVLMIEGLSCVVASRLFPVVDDLVMDFPDPNLEAAISEATGRRTRNIYRPDLTGLAVFLAGNTGIIDLTGLEHCTSPRTLSLYGNQMSDTVALSGLASLTYCGYKERKRTEG